MLSITARTSLRSLSRVPVTQAIAARSFAGFAGTYRQKESVEEDRFMREQEKAFFDKKRATMEKKMHAEEEKEYKEHVAPAMVQVEALLKKTGDSVGHDGLEAIAKWKLSLE